METKITQFLDHHLDKETYKVLTLAGDASARKYFRIIKDQNTYVLMFWEPFDHKSYPFLSTLNHFKNNRVHVPEVIAFNEKLGIVLLEDLGDLTLERKFWENQNPEHSLSYYQKSNDELIKIHFHSTLDKAPCTAHNTKFDTEKFLWEMNYGKDNLIKGVLQFAFNEKNEKELTDVFTDICKTLDDEPKFIAHRDYHSRNLMIKLDDIRVIDFQDARLGPIQYDLVSLYRDSYVQMTDETAAQLTNDYLEKAKKFLPKNFSREHFDHIYEIQSIQRCFKACGSFSSFYIQRQDTRYLKYIGHTLKRVIKSLNHFQKYKVFGNILIDSGALEKNYEAL